MTKNRYLDLLSLCITLYLQVWQSGIPLRFMIGAARGSLDLSRYRKVYSPQLSQSTSVASDDSSSSMGTCALLRE